MSRHGISSVPPASLWWVSRSFIKALTSACRCCSCCCCSLVAYANVCKVLKAMPNNLAETPNEVRNIKLKPTHTHTHTLTQGKQLLAVRLLSESKVKKRRAEKKIPPFGAGAKGKQNVNCFAGFGFFSLALSLFFSAQCQSLITRQTCNAPDLNLGSSLFICGVQKTH